MGCSQPQVSRYLRLLTLPEPVFASLKKGKITTAQALALKVTDELYSVEYLLEFLHRLEKENLSSRTLERMMKKSQTENKRRNQNRPSVLQTDQTRVQTDRFFLPAPDMPPEEKESNQRLKRSLGLA